MAIDDDDEAEERRRQEAERRKLSLLDRLYGTPPRRTADGFEDRRSARRTGRLIQLPFRVHPRVKAIILAIMERDRIPTLVMALELFVEAYLKVTGPLDEAALPSMEEIVERIENERDRRDGL